MPEYIAKLTHRCAALGRDIAQGDRVEIPREVAEADPWLYEAVTKTGGKPTTEDLINKALQMNLGKEADLAKLPYSELSRLIKSKE